MGPILLLREDRDRSALLHLRLELPSLPVLPLFASLPDECAPPLLEVRLGLSEALLPDLPGDLHLEAPDLLPVPFPELLHESRLLRDVLAEALERARTLQEFLEGDGAKHVQLFCFHWGFLILKGILYFHIKRNFPRGKFIPG